jgi:hypothetical protein
MFPGKNAFFPPVDTVICKEADCGLDVVGEVVYISKE